MGIHEVIKTDIEWRSIAHIDALNPNNSHENLVVEKVGDILLKHGASSRFSVFLIHKHFDVNQDESIVETTDTKKRLIKVNIRNDTENFAATGWVFGHNNAELALTSVKYTSTADLANIRLLQNSDRTVLFSIQSLLQDEGLTTRFGIELCTTRPEIDDTEILVEYTNEIKRKQLIVVEMRAALKSETMETLWSFGKHEGKSTMACVRHCIIAQTGFHEGRHGWV